MGFFHSVRNRPDLRHCPAWLHRQLNHTMNIDWHFLKSIIVSFVIGTTQSVFSLVDSLVIELQTFAFSFKGITRARLVLPFPSSRCLFVTLQFLIRVWYLRSRSVGLRSFCWIEEYYISFYHKLVCVRDLECEVFSCYFCSICQRILTCCTHPGEHQVTTWRFLLLTEAAEATDFLQQPTPDIDDS